MKGRGVLLVFFLCVNFVVWGEAPELRIVMPNSWEKITRISPEEEEPFIGQNEYPIRLIKGMAEKKMPEPRLKIYRQTVLDLDFYRVVFSPPEAVDFLSSGCRFFQGLIHNGNLLCVGVYNFLGSKLERGKRAYYYFYDSIDISTTTKGAVGVLLSTVQVPSDQSGSYFIKTRKGQYYGYPEACYFLVDSLPERVFLNQWHAGNYWPRIPNTFIYASECLVDVDMPLRYGLQNAFDNNPATSYVENTNDDLFRVSFDIRDERLFHLTALAVINGYAQNNSLYYNNNRVKRIRYTFDLWVAHHHPLSFVNESALQDNYEPVAFPEKMTYSQTYFAGMPPVRPTDDNNINVICLGLYINDIYPGNRYNDTCVAEINLLCDEGWLFGPVE